MSDVLTAPEVAALAAAVPDARVRALVRSHGRLRAFAGNLLTAEGGA
jgi:hypothetical protein